MTTSTSSSKIHVDQYDPEQLKAWIKAEALALGFSDCVIAKPDAQAELPRFKKYLELGYHGDMHFLAENLEKRADPTLLVRAPKALFVCVWIIWLPFLNHVLCLLHQIAPSLRVMHADVTITKSCVGV